MGVDEVRVRTPLTCETRYGLCASCYGRDLGRGHRVNAGEAVGVIAAQSIGEPGTQLTMRTFHIGGAASRAAAASQVETKSNGHIAYSANMRYVTNTKGEQLVIARSAEVLVLDDNGRERERHKVPYGATLMVKDGEAVKAGAVLGTWDPHTRPIITEYAGQVRFENVEEGATVVKQVDDVTGLSTLVVIDPKRKAGASKGVRPLVKLTDENGHDVKLTGTDTSVTITFQVGSIITVKDGQVVGVGEVLARIPQETAKTRDITGGLPRVAELFEARSPKDAGMLAEITGTMSFGKDTKGKQRLIITDPDGMAHEYLIPKDKHVMVHDGQVVNRGENIVDGPIDPHDILRLQGIEALARYIVQEVQEVYRLQGVKINDKHIEVIVRQMLRRVVISASGDTGFILGEQVERAEVLSMNDKMVAEGKQPAQYENILLGITKLRCRPIRLSRRIVPGNHTCSDRSRHHGQGRRTARSEGKRDRGSFDPGRYRSGIPPQSQTCSGQSGCTVGRNAGSGGRICHRWSGRRPIKQAGAGIPGSEPNALDVKRLIFLKSTTFLATLSLLNVASFIWWPGPCGLAARKKGPVRGV